MPSARSETLGKELKKNLNLCRVPDLGHSAKKLKTKKTNLCRVPNSRRSAKKDVAEHRYARQPMPSAAFLPRVWHSAKKSFVDCIFLPSAILCRVWHSAKKVFAECPIFNTRQRILHSAKALFPVVTTSVLRKPSPHAT